MYLHVVWFVCQFVFVCLWGHAKVCFHATYCEGDVLAREREIDFIVWYTAHYNMPLSGYPTHTV